MRVSGYLSVFDDWDLLADTLATVAPLLDELIVLDGAYAWMAPQLALQGRDPARSDPRVYAALENLPCPVRVITRVWRDETEKREAGFAACQGRYVLRVDADEDWSWLRGDPVDALGNHAVGDAEYPMLLTPDLMLATPGATIRQSVLFDSARVDARAHLSHLWLVLPPAERETVPAKDPALVHPEPVAFTAHLTHWRTPASSINRARFYVTNFMRDKGALPWLPGVPCVAADGFAAFFAAVPFDAFTDILLGHEIVAGAPDVTGHVLRPVPLDDARRDSLRPRYARLLSGLAEENARAANGRTVVGGMTCLLDISTPDAEHALGVRAGKLHLGFDAPLAAFRASVGSIGPGGPGLSDAPSKTQLQAVTVHIPQESPGRLRRTLRLQAWGAGRERLLRFAADRDR